MVHIHADRSCASTRESEKEKRKERRNKEEERRRERERYLNDCEMKGRSEKEKRKREQNVRKTEKKEEDEAKSAGFRPRLRRTAGAHSALLTSPSFFPFAARKKRTELSHGKWPSRQTQTISSRPRLCLQSVRFSCSVTDQSLVSRAALDEQTRKDTKSQNTNGNPIRLQSKILAIQGDPLSPGSVFVAQSSGVVRKISLEVGPWCVL